MNADARRVSVHVTARTRARRARALSMVESAFSVLLVGMVLVAALETVRSTTLAEQQAARRRVGTLLAQDLMTEILAQPVTAAAVPAVEKLGLDFIEIDILVGPAGSRADFDSVGDYDGWTASAPQHADGTEMTAYAAWRRDVRISNLRTTDLEDTTSTFTGVQRVEVDVFFRGLPVTTLRAVRTIAMPLPSETP